MSQKSFVESDDESLYPPFGQLHQRNVEFTNIFPEYPKTHVNGYATVIEFFSDMLTEEKIEQLIKGLQFSQNNQGGGGRRPQEDVVFFHKNYRRRI
jgi:hypothetical protein